LETAPSTSSPEGRQGLLRLHRDTEQKNQQGHHRRLQGEGRHDLAGEQHLQEAWKKGTEDRPSKLKASYFKIADKAQDKDDYIIYNKKTGVLSYDADGSGSKAAVDFAVIKKNLSLTYNDFAVI
jgi:16S rRNA U516 pseudouridylate synthase RsuA-like enzyme